MTPGEIARSVDKNGLLTWIDDRPIPLSAPFRPRRADRDHRNALHNAEQEEERPSRRQDYSWHWNAEP